MVKFKGKIANLYKINLKDIELIDNELYITDEALLFIKKKNERKYKMMDTKIDTFFKQLRDKKHDKTAYKIKGINLIISSKYLSARFAIPHQRIKDKMQEIKHIFSKQYKENENEVWLTEIFAKIIIKSLKE